MATGSEFDQFRHNREIEEAQANFYNHRQNSSQSLWSCFKNAVRKKKCTCHLYYLGKSLARSLTLIEWGSWDPFFYGEIAI